MKQQILSLGKDSLIYGVGSVVTRFIGLLTLPLFTAYLTPDEYGVLAMLALLTMAMQPIFSLGLGAAMGPCYFERDDIQNKSTVVWTTLLIHTLSSAFLIVIGWTYPALIAKLVRLSSEHYLLIGLSLTGCAFTIMATAITARVQFEKQAKLYVVVTLITALTAILVSILTVVYLGWGVKGMVIGQLSGNVITLVAFLINSIQNTQYAVCTRTAKTLLRLGLPLMPAFAFLFILMHANKYVLESKYGLNAVGVYSIGFNIGVAVSIITGGFASAWYPFFMNYINRQSEVRDLFGKVFTYYTIGVGFIVIFFFAFAKPVVMLLTNVEFHSAFMVVGLVATANYLIGFYNLFLPGMYYKKEIYMQGVIQGLSVITSIPITIYLIDINGVLGAGLGLMIGHLIMAGLAYLWSMFKRKDYVVVKYEWRRVLQFVLILTIVATTTLTIQVETIFYNFLLSISILMVAIFMIIQILKPSELDYMPLVKFFKV